MRLLIQNWKGCALRSRASAVAVERGLHAPGQKLRALGVPSDTKIPASHSDTWPDDGGGPTCDGRLPSPSPSLWHARMSGCEGTVKRAGTSYCPQLVPALSMHHSGALVTRMNRLWTAVS